MIAETRRARHLGLAMALLLGAPALAAQTVYITDELKAGLHEEKLPDSPITKVVPTGTRLEVIKREEDATFVREPGGTTGWIDNSYLVEDDPGTPPQVAAEQRIKELEDELTAARQEIRTLKAGQPREAPEPPAPVRELQQKISELQDELKAEKLKAGELQIQLSELRKRLGLDNEKASLYKEIETLKENNKELEVQLARARDNPEAAADEAGIVSRAGASLPWRGWRQLLVYLGITLIVGMVLGVYLMDVINRRRHGGFRV